MFIFSLVFLLVIKRKWYTSTEQQPNDTQMQIHQFLKGVQTPQNTMQCSHNLLKKKGDVLTIV